MRVVLHLICRENMATQKWEKDVMAITTGMQKEEKILIPELPKKSVVIMDNASFHKSLKKKEILSEHGHELEFLPSYSLDLNLIEHKWAQAKAIRRKHNCLTLELFQKYLL